MSGEELLNAFEEAIKVLPAERCIHLSNALSRYMGVWVTIRRAGISELAPVDYYGSQLLEARARLLPLVDELARVASGPDEGGLRREGVEADEEADARTDAERAEVWRSKLAEIKA